MIGGLIKTGIGAVGSIFGGIKASQAMKRVKQNIEAQKAANTDWYNRRYNEDATQRADAQRAITLTREQYRRNNQAAEGAQAVMGGTEESVAAQKAAANQSLANTTAQIAVNGEARKDNIEGQFRSRDAALGAQLNQMERDKANSITQATQGVVEGAGAMDFDFGKKA